MRSPVLALLVVAAALPPAGCLGGGPARPAAPEARAVTGSVELASAPATTRRAWFHLRGSVRPPDAQVTVLDARYLGLSAVPERRGAAFSARLGPLRPGVNRFVVEGAAAGHRTWRREVRIVRRGRAAALPRRVAVPEGDATPPVAALRIDAGTLVATASGRDAGGMARLRVSAEMRIDCEAGPARGLRLHVPPSMVEKVKVVPGTRLPTRLSRRVDLAAAAARRCGGPARRVSGRAWAEATDAYGLDGYSAYVRLRSG